MNSIKDIRRKVDPDGLNFEILGLQEVKDWLVESSDDNDNIIGRLTEQCVSAAEEYCHISLTPKIVTVTVDLDYNYYFELPYGPITSITSMKRRDGSDTLGVAEYETYDATNYYLDGELFKCLNSRTTGRHVIIYKAAYPEDELPGDLKLDILKLIAYCYENRGDQPEQWVEMFLHKHRRMCWV